MRNISLGLAFFLLISSNFAHSSDALPAGNIKNLSYRGSYINFRIVGSDGINYCSPCPVDPGGMNTQQCWISETSKVEVAMVLLASAQGKKIMGRVDGLTSNCNVYQLTIQD